MGSEQPTCVHCHGRHPEDFCCGVRMGNLRRRVYELEKTAKPVPEEIWHRLRECEDKLSGHELQAVIDRFDGLAERLAILEAAEGDHPRLLKRIANHSERLDALEQALTDGDDKRHAGAHLAVDWDAAVVCMADGESYEGPPIRDGEAIDELKERLDKLEMNRSSDLALKLEALERRDNAIEGRLGEVDQRVREAEEKLVAQAATDDALEGGLDRLTARGESTMKRLGAVEANLISGSTALDLSDLKDRMDRVWIRLDAITGTIEGAAEGTLGPSFGCTLRQQLDGFHRALGVLGNRQEILEKDWSLDRIQQRLNVLEAKSKDGEVRDRLESEAWDRITARIEALEKIDLWNSSGTTEVMELRDDIDKHRARLQQVWVRLDAITGGVEDPFGGELGTIEARIKQGFQQRPRCVDCGVAIRPGRCRCAECAGEVGSPIPTAGEVRCTLVEELGAYLVPRLCGQVVDKIVERLGFIDAK